MTVNAVQILQTGIKSNVKLLFVIFFRMLAPAETHGAVHPSEQMTACRV